MLAVSVALAACAYAGLITPWLLLAFTFLIGCGTALNNPSWQASVGDMVPRADAAGGGGAQQRQLQPHAQRRSGDRRRHRGGVGAAAAFAVNAVSYLPLIFVLGRWKPVIAAERRCRASRSARR